MSDTTNNSAMYSHSEHMLFITYTIDRRIKRTIWYMSLRKGFLRLPVLVKYSLISVSAKKSLKNP